MGFNRKAIGTLLTCGIALTACSFDTQTSDINPNTPFSSLNANRKIPPAIAKVIALLKEGKYNEASSLINLALQTQPKNISLHLLNSMTYEKLAELGNVAGVELAAVGYQTVINLDPTNVFAIAQLGKIKYRDQAFDQAQEHFANALLINPNNPELWQELAASSYYNYDLKTALTAITKAEKLKPEDPLIHRSAAMIYAALGDFKSSQKHLDFFTSKAGADPAVSQLKSRYNDWTNFYKSGRVALAAVQVAKPEATSTPSESDSGSSSSIVSPFGTSSSDSNGNTPSSPAQTSEADSTAPLPASAQPTAPEEPENPQIIIDCYLLRLSEDALTSKGNNILENLAVTLTPGSISRFKGSIWGSGVPALSPGATSSNASIVTPEPFNTGINSTSSVAGAFNSGTNTFSFNNKGSLSGHIFNAGLTWAGLTYSLNIANATDDRTEVVSRPSLLTFLNKQAVFFSGDELVNGFTGQYGGTLVKYPVGVTLDVTPQSLVGDVLTLQIGVEGSVVNSPNANLQNTVDVIKTRVDTFAKLRLGETLMLGGIYERAEIVSKSGFPGLQDVPIIQYFFSNELTLSAKRSVVFMLTPRSPDTVKALVNRAMARESISPHLRELIARNPDWYNTHANLITIFRYLATDPVIYYELRSTDILPPSWGWEPPIDSKLDQLVSFIYY